MQRVLLAFTAAAVLALGQGTETKKRVEDYPIHASAGEVQLGAEYNVRSVSSGQVSFMTDDYLTVEVALFPPREGMKINAGSWALRVNGKKDLILAQTPSMVASSLKYPDWNRQRGVVAAAGPIILGAPQQVPRFPGDTRGAPTPPISGQTEEQPPQDIGAILMQISLPEGPRRQPVSGYLFFPWRGNLTKIKSVELLYSAEEASPPVVLKLR
ncbi:MAG TPA: hypothetical protein VES20_00135 [Bryobacteraceae bacterium]|nr:hypothetical protein [Bryobacteraceae bacterium]